MVFFAITRAGYDELIAQLGHTPSPLWLDCDVLSVAEISDLQSNGIDVTAFSVPVTSSSERYQTALDTIWQHHPNDRLWAEYFAEP